jgi:hypothetical protein
MACNLFEGLDDGLLIDTEPQDHHPAGTCSALQLCLCLQEFESADDIHLPASTAGVGKTPFIASCGFRHILLHSSQGEQPALLALTASTEQQSQQQHQQGCVTLIAENSTINGWEQISGRSQLLRICQQPGGGCDGLGCGLAQLQPHCQPGCLLLCKQGSTLQLLAVDGSQQQQLQPAVRLLAELEVDFLKDLEQQQCWLAPGPLLLLQPDAEQLLLLSPAAAAGTAAATGVNSSSEGAVEWQLLELDVPAEQLLACLQQEVLVSMLATGAAGDVSLLASHTQSWDQQAFDSSSREPHHTAAGPLHVLHFGQAKQDSSSAQLLISLPVAASSRSGTASSVQQSLLLWLEVQLSSSEHMAPAASTVAAAAAADLADGQEGQTPEPAPALRVLCCYGTGWRDMPTCAAVHAPALPNACELAAADATAWQQHLAIGSSSGDVQLLQISCRPMPAQHQQQQHGTVASPQFDSSSSSSSSCICELQAAAKLPGPVYSIAQLAQVYVAGAVQHDVLAVLHGTAEIGSSSSSCVSLLVQQAGQLQVVAAVQSAAALLAPSCSSMGFMCPWQQHQQQQQFGSSRDTGATMLHSDALQLAALVLLNHSQQGAETTGLASYAWLDPDNARHQMPGAVVGLLRCLPPGHQTAAAVAAGSGKEGLAAAGSCNELRGLQSMLAALEARWQQGKCCCYQGSGYNI